MVNAISSSLFLRIYLKVAIAIELLALWLYFSNIIGLQHAGLLCLSLMAGLVMATLAECLWQDEDQLATEEVGGPSGEAA